MAPLLKAVHVARTDAEHLGDYGHRQRICEHGNQVESRSLPPTASSRPAVTCSMRERSAATELGVKALETSARIRVCSGGSILSRLRGMGCWSRSALACSDRSSPHNLRLRHRVRLIGLIDGTLIE